MRILHVNKFFDQRDGVDIYVHELMRRQTLAGHETHILATRSPWNAATPDARIFIRRYDLSKSEGILKDAHKAMNFLWNREARRAMRQAIAEFKPDLVHLHNVYHHLSTSILAEIRSARLPCVQTLHDYKLACPNYRMFTENATCERCKGGHYHEAIRHHCLWPTFSANALGALEMGWAKATQAYERTVKIFVCPSHFMADKMTEWGEPQSKMTVIPNATEITGKQATRDGGYVLFAGRLAVEKGAEVLIRAAARLPEMKIKIAGTGSDETRLRRLAEELNAKNVLFLGFVKRAENLELWERAQALIVPSIWYENASIAVLEAMGQGLPILASRIGGLPEQVVDGENGLLIEPRSVDAWEQGLRKFMSLAESDREAMASAARRRAEELFAWSGHLDRLEEAYQSAMGIRD
ncbi:glycosyltransferase [Candidatus Uhrbacteria bacterium]|nr:glycosyltransferase [Candidatus Uhrbacteria bacterium]